MMAPTVEVTAETARAAARSGRGITGSCWGTGADLAKPPRPQGPGRQNGQGHAGHQRAGLGALHELLAERVVGLLIPFADDIWALFLATLAVETMATNILVGRRRPVR